MKRYKEKDLWKLNGLVLRRSPLIVAGMAVLLLVLFPLAFLPSLLAGEGEMALAKGLTMLHGLLPLGILLPSMALLPAWMEERSRELLCAGAKIAAPCLTEALWVLRFYGLLCIVPAAVSCRLLRLPPLELPRLLVELAFIEGCFYAAMVMLRSALMGAMAAVAVDLFCLLGCRNDALASLCLLRPDLAFDAWTGSGSIGLVAFTIFLWIVAFRHEKRMSKIN